MDICLLSVFVLSVRGLGDGPIPRPEESYRVCVCVCLSVSLSVIRSNNNPLPLQRVGRRMRLRQEIGFIPNFVQRLIHDNWRRNTIEVWIKSFSAYDTQREFLSGLDLFIQQNRLSKVASYPLLWLKTKLEAGSPISAIGHGPSALNPHFYSQVT